MKKHGCLAVILGLGALTAYAEGPVNRGVSACQNAVDELVKASRIYQKSYDANPFPELCPNGINLGDADVDLPSVGSSGGGPTGGSGGSGGSSPCAPGSGVSAPDGFSNLIQALQTRTQGLKVDLDQAIAHVHDTCHD